MKNSPVRRLAWWVVLATVPLACGGDADPFGRAKTIRLQASVTLLNADTSSRLPLAVTILDQAGNRVNYPDSAVHLYADGVRLTHRPLRNLPYSPHGFYATDQPGPHQLQAQWGPLLSEPLTLTARRSPSYPLVRLPVVFHVARDLDLVKAGIALEPVLAGVNRLFRDQLANADPNHADSFIEFYLAPTDPAGRNLKQAGLNPLDFEDPPTNPASGAKADSVLEHWCFKQYVNIFVGINWLKRATTVGYSYSYMPPEPREPYPGDLDCAKVQSRAAIMLAGLPALQAGTVAHELGHMLGLNHAFGACGWSTDERVKDLPNQEEARPDGVNQKRACNQVVFLASNVMDYHNRRLGFSGDQVGVMRRIINYPVYLPVPGSRSAGRRSGPSVVGPLTGVECYR